MTPTVKLSRDVFIGLLEDMIPDLISVIEDLYAQKLTDITQSHIREHIAPYQLHGWAKLYLNPQNEYLAVLLMSMSPEQIAAWIATLPTASEDGEATCLDSYLQTMAADVQSARQPLNNDALTEARSYFFALAVMNNLLAYLTHGQSLYQLVHDALAGDDVAFLKAVQVDKTTLGTLPYFIARNHRAADEGDIAFQRRIADHRQKPIFTTRTRNWPLMLLFAFVHQARLLDDMASDGESFLALAERLGLYGMMNEAADLDSFMKSLNRFRKGQRLSSAVAHQRVIVTDTSSSTRCP